MIGCIPCEIPVNIETTINQRFAITPYAATPVLPAISINRKLNTIRTIPVEISVKNDGKPLAIIPPIALPEIFVLTTWKVFFFLMKYCIVKIKLKTGDKHVASTAPNIPIPNGKINNQSRNMLDILPTIMAIIDK